MGTGDRAGGLRRWAFGIGIGLLFLIGGFAGRPASVLAADGVELVNVMDTLREMAIEEGVDVKEKDIVSMHTTFLSLIKSLGRQHEISLLVLLKMKTKEFLKDMFLGMKMFMRGKLKIMPHRIKGMDEIKGIFERSKTKS